MSEPAFWTGIAPHLHVSEAAPGAPFPYDPDVVAGLDAEIRREGYWQVPGAIPVDRVTDLRVAAELLRKNKLPPVFLWMYDEAWHLFLRLQPYWTATLGTGYDVFPCLWTWQVPRGEQQTGWPPHRDRMKQQSIGPDSTPWSLSVWLPLTPATPLNGCIYVVPAKFSPKSSAEIKLQDVRALPAEPGDALVWRQDVWHWGARSSHKATTERLSMGLELHRAGTPVHERPLLDPTRTPDLRARCGLVGANIRRYRGRSGVSENLLALAQELIRIAPEMAETAP